MVKDGLKSCLLDANLLIAFLLRPEHRLAAAARAGRVWLFVCPYVLEEARRMLRRAFPARLAEFDRMVEDLGLGRIPDASHPVVERCRDYVSDRADAPVLAAALEAGLDAVVTSDRAFRADARATLALDGDPIRVLSVREALAALG